MLFALTSETAIARAQRQIETAFQQETHEKLHITIGYPSGSFQHDVFYSENLDIWWGFIGLSGDKYFNAFSLGRPRENYSNPMTVQVNHTIEGINRRLAGIVARDNEGNLFYLHDGGIGGGRPGVGKTLFFEKFTGTREEVSFGESSGWYAVVGQINSPRFTDQVAEFVRNVHHIKQLARQPEHTSHQSDLQTVGTAGSHSFNPEFSGQRKYNLPESVTANSDHGIVVSALRDALEALRLSAANTNQIDLYTYVNNNEIDRIFEVKTGLSTQTVYTAIGQLMFYSLPIPSNPKRYFVAPSEISTKLVADLRKLNIEVITYHWQERTPIFENLNYILNA